MEESPKSGGAAKSANPPSTSPTGKSASDLAAHEIGIQSAKVTKTCKGTKRKRPTRPPLVKHIANRALQAAPCDVKAFSPDVEDTMIANALRMGARTYKEFAEQTGLKRRTARHLLSDPVRCAWLAREMTKDPETILGWVYAGMVRAAAQGDVAAAKLIIERFDKEWKASGGKAEYTQNNYYNLSAKELDDADLKAQIQRMSEEQKAIE